MHIRVDFLDIVAGDPPYGPSHTEKRYSLELPVYSCEGGLAVGTHQVVGHGVARGVDPASRSKGGFVGGLLEGPELPLEHRRLHLHFKKGITAAPAGCEAGLIECRRRLDIPARHEGKGEHGDVVAEHTREAAEKAGAIGKLHEVGELMCEEQSEPALVSGTQPHPRRARDKERYVMGKRRVEAVRRRGSPPDNHRHRVGVVPEGRRHIVVDILGEGEDLSGRRLVTRLVDDAEVLGAHLPPAGKRDLRIGSGCVGRGGFSRGGAGAHKRCEHREAEHQESHGGCRRAAAAQSAQSAREKVRHTSRDSRDRRRCQWER